MIGDVMILSRIQLIILIQNCTGTRSKFCEVFKAQVIRNLKIFPFLPCVTILSVADFTLVAPILSVTFTFSSSSSLWSAP